MRPMAPWPEDRPHPMFGEARHALVHIERTHRAVHVRPPGDPSLSYVVFVPALWQAAEHDRAADVPADPIGRFVADAHEGAPELRVWASRPGWEIDPLEWVRGHLSRGGWRIAIARWLPQPEGRFEIGAVKSDDRGLHIRRCVGFLDGGRIVGIDTISEAPRWRAIHDVCWPCGMLLELHEPTEQARVESLGSHAGPLVAFSLPASWTATCMPGTGTRAATVQWIADIAEGAESDAGIRIDVTDLRGVRGGIASDIPWRQAVLSSDLRAHGIRLPFRLDRLPPSDDPGAPLPGWRGAWVGEAVDSGGRHLEVRLGHRDLGETRVDYVMLAPPRELHAMDWMRATRAFAIAIGTTVPAR